MHKLEEEFKRLSKLTGCAVLMRYLAYKYYRPPGKNVFVVLVSPIPDHACLFILNNVFSLLSFAWNILRVALLIYLLTNAKDSWHSMIMLLKT